MNPLDHLAPHADLPGPPPCPDDGSDLTGVHAAHIVGLALDPDTTPATLAATAEGIVAADRGTASRVFTALDCAADALSDALAPVDAHPCDDAPE